MSTPDISAKLAEALAVLQGSATYYSCHHEDALAERAAAAAQNIRELLAAPSASPAADWQRRLQTALTAPGCERLREWYGIGPVQRAAVEEFLVTALSASPAEAPPDAIPPEAQALIDLGKSIQRMEDMMAQFVADAALDSQPVAPAGQAAAGVHCHGCRLWPDPAPAVERGVAEERAAFEAWLVKHQRDAGYGARLRDDEFTHRDENGKYNSFIFDYAWLGWLARAALSTAGKEQA